MAYNPFVKFSELKKTAEEQARAIENLRNEVEAMGDKWTSYQAARANAVVAAELDARDSDFTVTEAMVAEYGALVGKLQEVVAAINAVAGLDYNLDLWK